MDVDSWTQVAASSESYAEGQAVPTPYLEAGGARETPTMECRCQKACNVEGCPCEGFGMCIGRDGHKSEIHRCRPVALSAAGAGGRRRGGTNLDTASAEAKSFEFKTAGAAGGEGSSEGCRH